MPTYNPPRTDSTSFNCPHCGALAQQFWYDIHADRMQKDGVPTWYRDDIEEYLDGLEETPDLTAEHKAEFLELAKRVNAMEVFFHEQKGSLYNCPQVKNLHVSTCYNCNSISVWIGHTLAYPETSTEFQATEDMPELVRRDFVEAAKIYSVSPRASAALLRVAVENLCNEINNKKQPIFDGIGDLVTRGLDEKIQRALDIVRVTGNDAVHPGQIDFDDTPEDAERLFKLVNLIVEKLITLPNEIDEVYAGIPEAKRKAIERRDSPKPSKSKKVDGA